jgi:hypothetical protein
LAYVDTRDVLRYMIVTDYKDRRIAKNMSEGSSCRFMVSAVDDARYKFAFAFPKDPAYRHIDNFGPL